MYCYGLLQGMRRVDEFLTKSLTEYHCLLCAVIEDTRECMSWSMDGVTEETSNTKMKSRELIYRDVKKGTWEPDEPNQ